MSLPGANVESEMQDFSSYKDVRFRIDHVGGEQKGEPEYFIGLPELPALMLVEFSGTLADLNEATVKDQPKLFTDIFELILTEESAARFTTRMSSREDPIGINQLNKILPWLMEQYGLRPTTPSSGSSGGSPNPDDGTNSTDTASPAESTSSDLEPPAS
jgi:hypothetical protein